MQEFDLDVFDIMSSAGLYLLHHLPMSTFRDGYLPTVHDLVGAQRLAGRQEQMYEQFARTLAAKVCIAFLLSWALPLLSLPMWMDFLSFCVCLCAKAWCHHISHNSVSVVRTTFKSMGKCKLWPQPTQNPWGDHHQIWVEWLRRGPLPPKKIGLLPPRGFCSPYRWNIHPSCLKFSTLFLVL